MSGYAAREGTAAHALLEICLNSEYRDGLPLDPETFRGMSIDMPAEEPGEHSFASPSGAKAWLICPKKLNAEAELGPEPLDPEYSIEVDDSMVRGVRMALEYVRERVSELEREYGPVTVKTECHVSPEYYLDTKDCDGISDITLIARSPAGTRFVEHIDYKHGRGVLVSVDDPQNDLYLLGTCAEYATDSDPVPFETAALTIVQPRCEESEAKIRSRALSVDKWLPKAVKRFKNGLRHLKEKPNNAVPHDDACRFCRARPVCKEYLESISIPLIGEDASAVSSEEALQKAFENMPRTPDEVKELDSESYAITLLLNRKRIEDALKAIEQYMIEQLQLPDPPALFVEMFELYPSRKNKIWKQDEEETLKFLKRIKVKDPDSDKMRALGKKDLTETKLLSPARVLNVYRSFGVTPTQLAAVQEAIETPPGDPRVRAKKED